MKKNSFFRLFIEKIKNRLMSTRIMVLNKLLLLLDFKNIRGHWIYTNDIGFITVIDLGANTGEFSKTLSNLCQCKCYLIEPNRELFDKLPPDYVKLNIAVTAEDKLVKFYLSSNPESSSLINQFEDRWGISSEVEVEGLSWKSLLERLNLTNSTIDILKIDIEGGEVDLFDSLNSDDFRTVRQISVEFHDWLNWELHERTVNIIKMITACGYVSFSNTPSHSWPVEMVFVSRDCLKFTFFQKQIYRLFNQVRFLRY